MKSSDYKHGADERLFVEANGDSKRRTSSFFEVADYEPRQKLQPLRGSFAIDHQDKPTKRLQSGALNCTGTFDKVPSRKAHLLKDDARIPGNQLHVPNQREIYSRHSRERQHEHQEKAFCEKQVREFLEDEVERAMKNVAQRTQAQVSLDLSNIISARLKAMGFHRYKYIVTTYVGDDNGQSLKIASRTFWEQSRDRSVTATACRKGVFIVASVYAVYYE